MNDLALFDLDHTLLLCDSDVEWTKFLINQGVLDKNMAEKKRDKFSNDYKNGVLNIDEFLDFQLYPLSQFSYDYLIEMHQIFFEEHIKSNISPKAYELVDKHHHLNDEVLLVSATNEFVITPIAHHFGIQNVIGVQLEKNEVGNYTGKYYGIPSFKEGKVLRVDAWLKERGLSFADYHRTYFYSDSFNDIPLLEKVSHPIVVNPDEKLSQYANQKNWIVIFLS